MEFRAWIQKAWNRGLPLIIIQCLVMLQFVADKFMVELTAAIGKAANKGLDALEYFAGCAVVTAALRARKYVTLPLDIVINKWLHNMSEPEGFAYSLWAATQAIPGALCMLAPVCSSWVWVCRSSSGRRKNNPMGNLALPWVREANQQVSRVCIILRVLILKAVFWVLEQPMSSLLALHDRFVELATEFCIHKVYMAMGAYGALTRKPSFLYSTFPQIAELKKKVPQGVKFNTRLAIRKGRAVTGKRAALKKSQEYPKGFGEAVARLYRKHERDIKIAAAGIQEADRTPVSFHDICGGLEGDLWEDADMPSVLLWLSKRSPQGPA